MHGGLPVIGVSVLVYGLVGAVVILRDALRRCRPGRPGATRPAMSDREVRAWPAASR